MQYCLSQRHMTLTYISTSNGISEAQAQITELDQDFRRAPAPFVGLLRKRYPFNFLEFIDKFKTILGETIRYKDSSLICAVFSQ